MMDPIEAAESRAEMMLEKLTDGLPEGRFRCPCCGEVSALDDAVPVNDNPFAMPVCDKCAEVTG